MALQIDALDEERIRTQIVDPALERIEKTTVPTIRAAGDELADRLVKEVSGVVNGALLGLQGIADKLVVDTAQLLAKQDGWELTITIPPITIRLNKPKE